MIKMVLALAHERLPKTLHADPPSSHIAWQKSGLAVLQEARAWPRSPERVRRAGISSFGISGTNAHVIVEERLRACPRPGRSDLLSRCCCPAETKPRCARRQAAGRAGSLARPELAWGDLLRTANVQRSHFAWRASLSVTSSAQAIEALCALSEGRPHPAVTKAQARERKGPVFVFSGDDSPWPAIGRTLLSQSPAFAEAIAECERALSPHVSWSLREVLQTDQADLTERTDVLQPVLFAVGVGLAAAYRSLGVRPVIVLGRGVGELSAAVVSGARSLAEAARAVTARARSISPGLVADRAEKDEEARFEQAAKPG